MRDWSIWTHLADNAELPDESFHAKSIVEILEDKRILIECHHGIREYSRSCIGICMKYGMLQIRGSDLELRRMTRDQLIVSGNIECISLTRRKPR